MHNSSSLSKIWYDDIYFADINVCSNCKREEATYLIGYHGQGIFQFEGKMISGSHFYPITPIANSWSCWRDFLMDVGVSIRKNYNYSKRVMFSNFEVMLLNCNCVSGIMIDVIPKMS